MPTTKTTKDPSLFGGSAHDATDDTIDMRGDRPDLQPAKPMSSTTLKMLELMKLGFDLIVIGPTPPVLIRNYSNGRELELIKCYAGTVQDVRDRGYIEPVSGSVYEKVGWLCYGLTPTGRRLFE